MPIVKLSQFFAAVELFRSRGGGLGPIFANHKMAMEGLLADPPTVQEVQLADAATVVVYAVEATLSLWPNNPHAIAPVTLEAGQHSSLYSSFDVFRVVLEHGGPEYWWNYMIRQPPNGLGIPVSSLNQIFIDDIHLQEKAKEITTITTTPASSTPILQTSQTPVSQPSQVLGNIVGSGTGLVLLGLAWLLTRKG